MRMGTKILVVGVMAASAMAAWAAGQFDESVVVTRQVVVATNAVPTVLTTNIAGGLIRGSVTITSTSDVPVALYATTNATVPELILSNGTHTVSWPVAPLLDRGGRSLGSTSVNVWVTERFGVAR
jgi:hypothetical protein